MKVFDDGLLLPRPGWPAAGKEWGRRMPVVLRPKGQERELERRKRYA